MQNFPIYKVWRQIIFEIDFLNIDSKISRKSADKFPRLNI